MKVSGSWGLRVLGSHGLKVSKSWCQGLKFFKSQGSPGLKISRSQGLRGSIKCIVTVDIIGTAEAI